MDYSSTTELRLDVWNDSGTFLADNDLTDRPSDGTFEVNVNLVNIPGGGSSNDHARIRQLEDFSNTIQFVVDNQRQLYETILDCAQREYDKALVDKDAYDPEMVDLYLPPVNSRDDLKALLLPLNIHVGCTDEEGVKYVAYEFDCSWDDEHGFGVRMNGFEVEESGHASVGF
ncbi:MAG: hypothetical protein JWN82_115 [Candidatus Saccharibacteria bacterium]|nr:hypothetical protein [Candidatus Saccharibacteria bacterium]